MRHLLRALVARPTPASQNDRPRAAPAGAAAAPSAPRRAGRGALRWLAAAALACAAPLAWAADPQLTQFTDSPDPVPAGGNVTYTARIDNGTLDAATNVRVVVPVPVGTSFVSASAPCARVGTDVVCDLGTVGANGTDVRMLDFVFRAAGPGTATVAATATLSGSNDSNTSNNVQTQTTTVAEGSDLSLTKTGTPNPVVGGGQVTYTLTASNAGPNATRGIVVTDTLPPSATFVSASGLGWGCSNAGGVVTCTHPGPFAPGAAIAPVNVTARIDAPAGTVTNRAAVAPAVGGVADPDGGNDGATFNTTVLPGADVAIAQKVVVSGSPARAGGSVTFRIDPRNAGPVAAADVVVTDNLPAGWSVVSAGGPNWACSVAATTVTCTRATLPVGAADDITVVTTAPPAASVGPAGTTYTNTAGIASSTVDPAPGNNSRSVQVTVLPEGADLRLAMSKTPTRVARGAELAAVLRVTNNGPLVATGRLRVIDQLAAGEAYVSSSGTDWNCTPNGRTVVCDYFNTAGLAVGATAPVLFVVSQATATGALFNTACTGSTVPAGTAAGTTASPPVEGDYVAANDCITVASTATAGGPDLSIAKTTSTPTGGDKFVSDGEGSVTYTLVVTNATAAPAVDVATGIRITDTVPAAVAGTTIVPPVATVSAGSTASFNCNVSSGTVTCTQTGGALRPGATVTVPITVNRPLAAGTYTNTASVSNTVEGDSNPANNSASDTVTISGIADIELTGKTVSPAGVRAGERATYVVSYRNNGPSAAAAVTLSDTFAFPAGDPGLTVVSIAPTQPGATCSIAAGAQLTPAAPAYTCSLGSLAPGETQSVTLVVSPNFQSGNPTRSVVNTAAIATPTPESPGGGDNGNNRRSVTLVIDPAQVDLLTNKIDFQDPVLFAGNAFLDYRVTVTSNTPASATGVRISEVMTPPAGRRVRFVCDTAGPASATCNAPSLCSATGVTSAPGAALPFSCVLPAGTPATGAAQGSLAPLASKAVFLRFEALDSPAAAGDNYRNVATVVANEPDSFPGNDSSDEQTSVRQRIDLAVAKSASAASVALRQPFVWTVRVTNNGPGNALQTDVTDTLPAGVALAGAVTYTKTAPAGSGSCTVAGSVVSCAMGALGNGGVATISVPVRVDAYPAGGSVANTAVVDVDMTKIGGADPVPGNDSATSSVAVTRASLSGTVFEDRDRAGANAGTPQPAEPRIAGVALRLTGTDAAGNAVDLATTTDAAGNYVFADLAPSGAAGYTVTETQPAGYGNSPAVPPAPAAGGTYTAAGPGGNSLYGGVVVGVATVATGYNFPELRQASLGGSVYIDRNANGMRDAAGDPPVPGATVRLLDAASGALVASATSDAAGAYLFTGLDAARLYTLEEPLPASPAGLSNGPVNPGRVGGAPCATGCTAQPDTPAPGTDRIASIDLGAGDGTGFDFGELQRAAIAGVVYVDADRDNTLTAADTVRLPGVTLRLVQGADCTSGTTLQTQASGADGSYRFDNLAAAQDYLVCETQPAGYGVGNAKGVPGSNAVAVAALPLAGSVDNHFGETVAAIAGAVYQDNGAGTPANADNGVRDAGEPGIAGVTITLTGRDITGATVNLSTVTDASGNYRLDNLLQSDAAGYSIVEGAIPPAAGTFANGRVTVGTAGGSASGGDRVAGAVLGAGVQATGYLFGELPLAAVSGTVYLDRNRSGTLDAVPTDGRIAGVTVTLHAGGSCTGALVASATTDATGAYTLVGATAGLPYTVCETQPAGYAEGAANAGAGATVVNPSTLAIATLPAAGSAGNHFGERAGSLAGSVFLDANNDGVRNGGEAGIAGVTVTLTGTDAPGAAVSRTATTDATGAWRFDDLLAAGAGGYTVTEQAAQPTVGGAATLNGRTAAGTAGGTVTPVATTPSAVSGIALAAGTDATAYDFGELAAATLSGAVFVDANDNGVREAGEAGLAGVAISLAGTDDLGAAVSRSATTAADGSYAFASLRPGTYTLTQPTQPANTSNGMTVAGTAGGTPTSRATLPSAIAGIVLAPGATGSGYGFAELAATASVTGTVYLDRNRNGALDAVPTDGRIAGVTVALYAGGSCTGAPVATATTDASGAYTLAGATAGLPYTVCETQPAGYAEGAANAGAGATVVNPSTLAIATLPAAGSAGNHFGERAGSLAGSVFLDANNDGVRNGGEAGIAGVTVTLTGTDASSAAVSRTATTDATGAWRFDDLLAAGAGGYTVTEQAAQPTVGGAATLNGRTAAGTAGGTATPVATTPSAVSGIALAAGTDATAYDFGELAAATLSGAVFVDANDNGVREAGEAGLAGVAISLAGTDDLGAAVSRSATTAADGSYAFAGLRPGTYTLTQPTQPADTSNGTTTAGSAGGTPTSRGTVPSAIAGIVLAPGATAGGYGFAELAATASIAGRVWLDLDNDGTIGAGEAGIAGVTIELSGTQAGGGSVTRSAFTDAQGAYAFTGLLPGTYAVRQPAQPTGTLSGRTSAGNSGGTATGPATTPSAVSGIALAAGQAASGVGFGELPPASIGGRVYVDADGNGRPDAGEPGIAGVALRLTGSDDLGAVVTLAAATDASGAYAFAGLRPGSYTITEPDQPPGTTNGITRAGSAGGTATPPPTLPSAISAIALAPGVQSAGNDFGEAGSSPDLLAGASSVEARFTVGGAGSYTLRVRNAGSAPTSGGYTVSDRLPAGLTLDGTPSGAGWTCTVAAGGQTFACTSAEPLAAGAANPNPIVVRVRIAAPALAGSPVSNAVLVEGGGESAARAPSTAERDAFAANPAALPLCTAAIAHNACRAATPVQAAASVSGTVWLDAGGTRGALDGGDRRLPGWNIEVTDAAGGVVARAVTGADGSWRIGELTPGVPLAVRFRDPQSGIVWAYPVNGEQGPGSSGAACDPAGAQAGGGFSSCAAGGADASLGIVLAAGRDLPQQGLPVDPSLLYDAATRQPVAGAVVTLAPTGSCPGWNPASGVVAATLGGYAVSGDAVSMTVGADGRYQFVLSPAAPSNCTFGLAVTPPTGLRFPSTLIPPTAGPFTPPGAPGSAYAVQPQAGAPTGPAGPATEYHLAFAAGSALPRIVHNHIPLDAAVPGGLSLQKTGDRALAEVGDSVRYTVTVQATAGTAPAQTTIVDRLPAGFTYIPGTALVGGVPVADPAGRPGPRLTFELGPMPASGQLVLQYRLRVGVGAQQGDGENRARGYACSVPGSCVGADGATPLAGAAASNEARYRVRVGGGVFATEACVLGKIFVDCNNNHVQDAEELGIPGVRLLFSDGTFLVSDSEGKYSYCGLPPRGHVLKVDPWTLPRGSRLTTTSNRNLGDAGSLWLDLKNGELHRADFAEGSCSATVLDQVKARRAQGEVRSVETERPRGPALRFESKAHGLDRAGAPRQATDSADQPVPKAREDRAAPAAASKGGATDAAR